MKKICKIMLALFIVCFLAGCEQNVSEEAGKSVGNQKTEDKSQITKSVISKAELTPKEEFYLNTSASGGTPVAFDTVYSKDFHSMTYKVYNFENGKWNEIDKGTYDLEDNMLWIVVEENLTELTISVGNGKTYHSKNEEMPVKHLNNFVADYKTLEKYEIEKSEELPAIAYREFLDENGESKTANLSDFNFPEQVTVGENENYLMLTFTFE